MPPGAKPVGQSVAHLAGCPASRIETYSARRPNGGALAVTRCLDCGGASYEEKEKANV